MGCCCCCCCGCYSCCGLCLVCYTYRKYITLKNCYVRVKFSYTITSDIHMCACIILFNVFNNEVRTLHLDYLFMHTNSVIIFVTRLCNVSIFFGIITTDIVLSPHFVHFAHLLSFFFFLFFEPFLGLVSKKQNKFTERLSQKCSHR